ncbi:MAG: membrane-associated protein [Parcubacteria bacterium C7867-001]|nr:MAG: membrane-associated protein [Parcubacteria bacterium C7867-001]
MLSSLLHVSLPELIQSAGYVGLFLIVFCESGIPFGFIFPGDTLLFVAGIASTQGFFEIVPLALTVTVAAILGDSAGYWIGRKLGPKIFTKEDSFFFNKKHLERTQEFYARFGGRAIIFARFLAVVRTFVPIFAGVGNMPYGKFITYNIIGAIIWGAGLTTLGHILGKTFPQIQEYLTPFIIIILVVSVIPFWIEFYKMHRKNRP